MRDAVTGPWLWPAWDVAPAPTLPPPIVAPAPAPAPRVLVTEEERTSPAIPEAARVVSVRGRV